MTRPAARASSSRRIGTDLDGWLLDEPELDEAGIALLAAYRDAAEAARRAMPQPAVSASSADGEPPAEPAAVRVQPMVLRLRSVSGVGDDQLAGLHGRMLAAGYLTAEVVGKGEGLAYRITREGLRRLTGEAAEPEAA